MKKNLFYFLALSLAIFQSCIGDDIEPDEVPEQIRVLNPLDSLGVDSTFQLEYSYFNNVGQEDTNSVEWISTDESILSVSPLGLITGKTTGTAKIIAKSESIIRKQILLLVTDTFEMSVAVGARTVLKSDKKAEGRTVTINTTSSYDLSGSGALKSTPSGLVLELNENYNADTNLPDLVVYLSNNPNTNNGALQIAEVSIFNGAHSYIVPGNPDINQYSHVLYYCRKFSVKVGDGKLAE